mmetsp:Transcript_17453/g.52732  ORF Transcript_17453/g.52732 Transcript_17453/m.52732 type:complete len:211 (-) Transcript_17453:387-1019(-)
MDVGWPSNTCGAPLSCDCCRKPAHRNWWWRLGGSRLSAFSRSHPKGEPGGWTPAPLPALPTPRSACRGFFLAPTTSADELRDETRGLRLACCCLPGLASRPRPPAFAGLRGGESPMRCAGRCTRWSSGSSEKNGNPALLTELARTERHRRSPPRWPVLELLPPRHKPISSADSGPPKGSSATEGHSACGADPGVAGSTAMDNAHCAATAE